MNEPAGRLAKERGFAPYDPDQAGAEPTPKRVRARADDRWILDTDQAFLAWLEGPGPDFAIPLNAFNVEIQRKGEGDAEELGKHEKVALGLEDDGHEDAGILLRSPPEPLAALEDHVILDRDAVDAWFVEDERLRGHPRDPYHRIDVHESSRPVHVTADGRELGKTERAMALFETGLPVRFYIPEVDVRQGLLEPSSTEARCPYKGKSVYYHADVDGQRWEDVAWSYPSPEPGFGRLKDRVCFHQEHVTVTLDGSPL